MKRLLTIAILTLAVLLSCDAQTKTIVGSTITVAWDAPALGAIPAAEISYEVALQPYPSGTQTMVGTISALEEPVTFSAEGQYKIGVRVKRTVAVTGDILYSAWAWSDLEKSPSPWYAAYFASPPKVLKVRIK